MRWLVVLVVAALAAAVAGCGGSDDSGGGSGGASSGSDARSARSAAQRRFSARVEPICARAVRRFDRVRVPADLQERITSSRSTARIYTSLRRSLRRLRPPGEDRDAWASLTSEMRNSHSLYLKVARAAERGDRGSVATFVRLTDEGARNVAHLGEDVLDIGRCAPQPEG